MSICEQLRQHGLEWKHTFMDMVPQWTADPSVETIQRIASKYLPDYTDYPVTFLAGGAFHKLYNVSDHYIMRVALPVDPYYKTASEVATLAYIRRHTSIPVPRVLAYCADTSNELEFEWILMERMIGEPLEDSLMSAAISMHTKEAWVKQIALWAVELDQLRFSAIGSLYFKEQLERDETEESAEFPAENDPEFCLGPGVRGDWFIGHRIFLQKDRGPHSSDTAFVCALIDLQIRALENPDPGKEADSDDSDDETEDLIGVYRQLREICPTIFPDGGTAELPFVIYNGDISKMNILIDPATHTITGWVDWESVNTMPVWATRGVPTFLEGRDLDKQGLQYVPVTNFCREDGDDESILEMKETQLKMHLRKIWERWREAQVEEGTCIVSEGMVKQRFLEVVSFTDLFGFEYGERWIQEWNTVKSRDL